MANAEIASPAPQPSAGPTHAMEVELQAPEVALTAAQYERIKTRIRREIMGTLTTSLWIAIAIGAATLGASLVITVNSASLGASTTGQFELGYWVSFAFAAFCVLVHFLTRRDAETRAEDLIEEIETNLVRTTGSS